MPINRFTNLTPSTYKPMSMQEIMMTPLAMRQQHNQTQEQVQSGLAELDKINSLDYHTPELTERKNMLISQIDALSSDLANKGFSNDMTTSVIKLNRNIKDELGPQGRLGQIQGAYNAYQKNFEDFKKSNADKNWDDVTMKSNWVKHTATYQGYDEKGNITNIGSLSAPEKIDMVDMFKELKSVTGDASLAYKTLTGGTTWFPGPNGSMMSRDTETGKEIKYNNPQVVSLLTQVVSKLNDPTSDLSKSRVYSGRSIEQALEESGNLAKSMVNVELGQTNKSKENIHAPKNSLDAAAEAAANAVNLVDTSEDPLHNEKSYGQAIQTINHLKEVEKTRALTDDEKEQYTTAKGLELNYKNNIKDVNIGDKFTKENGKTLAKHYANELGLPSGTRVNFKYVEDLKTKKDNEFIKKYKGTVHEKLAKSIVSDFEKYKQLYSDAEFKGPLNLVGEYDKKVKNINKVYHNYKNDIFKYGNNYSNYYMPVTSDSQSQTGKRFEVLHELLSNSAKSSSSENTLGNISSVTDSKGKVHRLADLKDVTSTRTNISNVMRSAKSIKIVGFSENDGGFPSLKFMVTPNDGDDSSEDIENSGFIDSTVGKGKSFDVVIRLGDFSNIKNSKNKYGTNSAMIEMFNVMEQTGDLKTKEFVKNAKQRLASLAND